MGKYYDLSGEKFGRLKVIERVENKANRIQFLCICECGNEKITSSELLRRGSVRSCGCLRKELAAKQLRKHKVSSEENKRLYRSWQKMNLRCFDPDDKKFKDYGARGITVCDQWRDFSTYANWAFENGYSDELTLDRIDVNGDYTPDNCRWADYFVQSRNSRLRKTNTSGCRGVCFYKRTKQWTARITAGERYFLGYFDNKEEAISARKKAELEYWGYNVDENGIVEEVIL